MEVIYGVSNSSTNESRPIYIYDRNDSDITSSWTSVKAGNKTAKENIQGEITVEQKKMIKEEIKIWLDDYLKMSIEKEAGKILKDIEKLKDEKTRLGKSISGLKQEVRKIKKDINVEIKALEEILEKYDDKILRFYNIDL